MSTIALEDSLGITFCNRQPLAIERGQGSVVWDEAGREYLDFTSGWGVTCLGHAHPCITEAISVQAGKIIQNPNSGFTYAPTRARLLALLRTVLPKSLSHVYFANSGAEANDAALKLARKVTGKSKVISASASFHGRTFNTLSVSGGIENTSRYLPTQPDNCFVEFGNLSALESCLDDETAAVILEPVQGEGGVRIPPADYLGKVAALCKERGALLIVDEIQTGFCRTGRFFALQHGDVEVQPDLLTMGKGIAGGFPFAAFAVSSAVNARLAKGDHGGTYCGNPLGCAVSLAVVSYLIEHDVADRVVVAGAALMAGLQKLQRQFPSLIEQVRGVGLLCAIQLSDDAEVLALSQACQEQDLLVTPTRNRVVRLIPSLLVTDQEIATALARLEVALSRVVHCL